MLTATPWEKELRHVQHEPDAGKLLADIFEGTTMLITEDNQPVTRLGTGQPHRASFNRWLQEAASHDIAAVRDAVRRHLTKLLSSDPGRQFSSKSITAAAINSAPVVRALTAGRALFPRVPPNQFKSFPSLMLEEILTEDRALWIKTRGKEPHYFQGEAPSLDDLRYEAVSGLPYSKRFDAEG